MPLKIENWSPEDDKFLKKGEIDLHQFLHARRSESSPTSESILKTKEFRWQCLQDAIGKSGGVSGRILEVGAGDGWCSAAVLAHYPVREACIVEIDDAAVTGLIPSTLEAFGVTDREITLAKGSFNRIPKEGYFDFAFAMGALHHSSNLYATFRSLYLALRPGGVLFSQEPCMADSTPNSFYTDRDAQTTAFQEGIEIVNRDRSDTFFRECEYRTAALHAGFDVTMNRVFRPEPKMGVVQKLRAGFSSKPPGVEADKPYNVFISARKPAGRGTVVPLTAWEADR